MKKLILVMAIVTVMCTSVSAGEVIWGIKAGLNLADLTGDEIEEKEKRITAGGGIFLDILITEYFSVRPEMLYIPKGVRASELENSGINLSYVEVPLLAKFRLPNESAFSPGFFLGPYVGIITKAEIEIANISTNIKNDMKNADFGMVLGAGLDMNAGKGIITVEGRYSFSFSSITYLEDDGDKIDWKNSDITFMAAYGISF